MVQYDDIDWWWWYWWWWKMKWSSDGDDSDGDDSDGDSDTLGDDSDGVIVMATDQVMVMTSLTVIYHHHHHQPVDHHHPHCHQIIIWETGEWWWPSSNGLWAWSSTHPSWGGEKDCVLSWGTEKGSRASIRDSVSSREVIAICASKQTGLSWEWQCVHWASENVPIQVRL